MLGQTLGSYTIERELGRGGMGAVYTAVHGLLGRRAAVKVLLAELSRNQEIVQRFFNEARAATAIKHPSIVEIYDFGWAPDGSAYIVMELMDGESLASRIKRLGRLPVASAVTIARQAANALAAAHKAGIVHRDLKPDNVFLVPDVEVAGGERVKLLDFGIAKLVADGGVSRTSTGAVMGTPLYMSPEQCEGARQVDQRSDLYSLGCMLFEMVAGRPPFVSEGVGGLIGMHLHVPPPTVRSLAPDAPADLEALIARLLAKHPGDRPQSADEVAVALGRLSGAAGAAPSLPPHAVPTPPPALAVGTTLSAASGAATSPPAPSRRGLWLGVAGAAVAIAAIVVIVLASSGSKPAEVAATPAITIDAAPAPEPAVAVDAAPAPVIDAAPAADPQRDHRVQLELAAMKAAMARQEWKRLRDGLDAIYDLTADGDPRRAEGDALVDEARPRAIKHYLGEVHRLSKAGQCKGARGLAGMVIERWGGPEADRLTKAANACVERAAPPPPPPPPPPGGDADDLVAQAETAAKASMWGKALRLAEEALGGRPAPHTRTRALMVAAIAACNLKQTEKARRHFGQLPANRQPLVRQRCLANGVALEPPAPVY